MPIPRQPSRFYRDLSVVSCGDDRTAWFEHVRSEEDLAKLLRTTRGVPGRWLKWVDQQVAALERRGREVRDPLAYRCALLWQGIVLLQEAKFPCGVLENTMREGVEAWLRDQEVGLYQIRQTVPGWAELEERLICQGSPEDLDRLWRERGLTEFTFYQLAATVSRHWKRLRPGRGTASKAGFRGMFWADPSCRDVAAFDGDMKSIRTTRNAVAHSGTRSPTRSGR